MASHFRRYTLGNLISVDEAAKRLGNISPWTVRAWISQKRLQRVKVGSRTMLREEELSKVIVEDGVSRSPNRRTVKPEAK